MTYFESPATPPAPRTGGSRPAAGVSAAGGTLNPGDVVGERYEILQLLGEGASFVNAYSRGDARKPNNSLILATSLPNNLPDWWQSVRDLTPS